MESNIHIFLFSNESRPMGCDPIAVSYLFSSLPGEVDVLDIDRYRRHPLLGLSEVSCEWSHLPLRHDQDILLKTCTITHTDISTRAFKTHAKAHGCLQSLTRSNIIGLTVYGTHPFKVQVTIHLFYAHL